MDAKILIVIGAVSLLVLIGATFAASGWLRGNGTFQPALHNRTGNFTLQNMKWNYGIMANASFNSTELQQFRQAVLTGDYQTADSLHNEYGFGGTMFGKLNETTFAQYSQIMNLTSELRTELGMKTPRFANLGGFKLCHRLVNHHPANQNQ